MIILLSFLQLFALLIGIFIAKKAYNKNPHINFDSAHKESKPLMFVSLCIFIFFIFGVIGIRFDTFLELTPLIYQKYVFPYTWSFIAIFIGLTSGYILYLLFKLKKYKSSTYLYSIFLLNILFLLANNQINGYIGNSIEVKTNIGKNILQTTNYSCTSASIATVARGFNIDIGEKDAAKLTRLTKYGAHYGQIRYALNKLGIQHNTLRQKYNKLSNITPPAILYVDHPSIGYEGHAVVYQGVIEDDYKIWDPLKGHTIWSQEKVLELWHGNGIQCFINEVNSPAKIKRS